MATAQQIRELITETTTGAVRPRVPREVRDHFVAPAPTSPASIAVDAMTDALDASELAGIDWEQSATGEKGCFLGTSDKNSFSQMPTG